MPGSIGPLLPADERFDHQIVDTFASVAQTHLSWTEKVCGMVGGGEGVGNCQPVAVGAWPDFGLPTADDSFL